MTRNEAQVNGDVSCSRFGDSPRDWLRITTVRVVVQAVLFGLFLALVLLNTFANLDRLPVLREWVSKFLEIDPLVGLATALSTHTVFRGLVWSLVVLIPTLLLGRFFCNWVCPFGTLHHFAGWLLERKERGGEPNRYRPSQRVKYGLLIAFLVAAAFGSVQVGLLDPLCLLYRSLTGAVVPAVALPAPGWFGPERLTQGAWLIGFIVLGLLAANVVYPRFFCRVLCPLGGLLGLLSRFAWWRIERDPGRCSGCGRCQLHCEGACDPQGRLRQAECFVCFNCIEECPEGALRFAFLPSKSSARLSPDPSRRHLLFAGLAGLLFHPLTRLTGRSGRDFSSRLIRPPGAVEESQFLERCIKCEQCARVCPTNVIQADWFEGGLEGLWAPVLNYRIGACQPNCTACGEVCPTGALERLTAAGKLGQGPYAARGPIRLGTAHIDVGRCLPYSAGLACQVCEEVCPTSPKAIRTTLQPATSLRVPQVDIQACIGCGLCEYNCPVVGDRRAIYVTAEGESRSANRPERDRNRAVRLRDATRPG